MSKPGKLRLLLALAVVALFAMYQTITAEVGFRAKDPGVQGGDRGTGRMLAGLSAAEQEMFEVGLEDFSENEEIADGVGPRFNAPGWRSAT